MEGKRRILQSSENRSKTSKLAAYWNKNKKRITFPFNSKKFFAEWQAAKGELNVASFLRTFNFGYLEFGRYVKQNEREARFAGLAEGCMVLSSGLFFNSSNLGCDREINIAIGARGFGSSAMAHFEPANMVINTTKKTGNHAFAHEYAHALDFCLGRFFDQNSKFIYLSSGYNINDLDKNSGGRLRNVVSRIVLEAAKQTPAIFTVSNDYWRRPTEIFARAFEAWISWTFNKIDNGKSYKFSNSFLVHNWSYYRINYSVYPLDMEELDKWFMVFCQLVSEAMEGKSLDSLSNINNAYVRAYTRRKKTGAYRSAQPVKPKQLTIPFGEELKEIKAAAAKKVKSTTTKRK